MILKMKLQKRNSTFIKVLALTAAIMLTVIAAGCNLGSEKPGPQTTEKTDRPQTEQTDEPLSTPGATEAPQPTAAVDRNMPDDIDVSGDITFMYYDMGMTEEMPGAIKAVADAFEKKYPNAKVSYESVSSALINSRISSGDISDVFWCDPYDVHTYHDKLDALLPLDPYIEPYNIDLGNVYPGALEAGKSAGSLW